MKKVELTLSQFDRDLILQHGSAKFFIYYRWNEIVGRDERFKGLTIRRISYASDGAITIHVHASNSGSALKLRYSFHELEERIKSKIGCEVKLVLSS